MLTLTQCHLQLRLDRLRPREDVARRPASGGATDPARHRPARPLERQDPPTALTADAGRTPGGPR